MKQVLFLFAVALLASCKDSTSPATTAALPDSLRFPTNALFEVNGVPSLNGWSYHPDIPGDTAGFDKDAPSGGTWSLKLHKADTPHGTNNVTEGFTNLTSGLYELTAWIKTKYANFAVDTNAQGWISITKKRNGLSTTTLSRSGTDTLWHSVSVFDTLSLFSTDSVIIELSAAATDTITHGNPTWFDDVTFQKVK